MPHLCRKRTLSNGKCKKPTPQPEGTSLRFLRPGVSGVDSERRHGAPGVHRWAKATAHLHFFVKHGRPPVSLGSRPTDVTPLRSRRRRIAARRRTAQGRIGAVFSERRAERAPVHGQRRRDRPVKMSAWSATRRRMTAHVELEARRFRLGAKSSCFLLGLSSSSVAH